MGIVPNPKQHVANLQEIHRRRLRSRPTPASPQQERTTGPAAWSPALTAAQDSRTGGSPEGPPSRCSTRHGGGAGPEERGAGESVGQVLGAALHHRRRLWRGAVLVEAAWFDFRTTYVTAGDFMASTGGKVPLVLDWVVGKVTCREAMRNTTAYACVSSNSVCVDSVNDYGYMCNCSQGYKGNPYLPGGCQGTVIY